MIRIRSLPTLVAFLLLMIVVVACALGTYLNLQRLQAHRERVSRTYEMRSRLHTVNSLLLDSESAVRGYVITHKSVFLDPFKNSRKQALEWLSEAKALTSDHLAQQQRVMLLEQQITERFKYMQGTVELRDSEGFLAARDRTALGIGRAMTTEILAILAEIEAEELQLLAERTTAMEQSYAATVAMTLTSAVLGLALSMLGYVMVVREMHIRDAHRDSLADANSQLEARIQERTASIQEVNKTLQHEVEERKKAEELERMALLELQRSNRELEQFASVASHDLQEPLRKIQAFGDRLASQFRETLGEKGVDYLDRILASANRMRRLIDDLLSYARISSKAQPFAPLDLNVLAREVVSDLEGRISREEGTVELGEMPSLEADPLQMRQLLQNLIGNGLKFRQPGIPPVVTVTSRALEDGAKYEIVVRDQGIGFEQVYADRIFELFQRLHGRNEYEGTGMGLAICRKIVERHGGTIVATSTPNAGTAFTVVLPASHGASES